MDCCKSIFFNEPRSFIGSLSLKSRLAAVSGQTNPHMDKLTSRSAGPGEESCPSPTLLIASLCSAASHGSCHVAFGGLNQITAKIKHTLAAVFFAEVAVAPS